MGSDLRYLLIAAARAMGSGGGERSNADVMNPLVGVAANLGWVSTALVVDEVFRDCLEGAWEGSWLPTELVRAVRRRLTERHADLVHSHRRASRHHRCDTARPLGGSVAGTGGS